jgi:hypothetical protein
MQRVHGIKMHFHFRVPNTMQLCVGALHLCYVPLIFHLSCQIYQPCLGGGGCCRISFEDLCLVQMNLFQLYIIDHFFLIHLKKGLPLFKN